MPQRTIQSAVGGPPAANRNPDQLVIIDLLSNIDPVNGGSIGALPPAQFSGRVDFRLTNAILNFQLEMVRRGRMPRHFADGRVDPGGTSLRLMNEMSGLHGGGRGLVIPVDPKPPAPTPKPSRPDFFKPLFDKMRPRPSNLKINPGASLSGGAKVFSVMGASFTVADNRPPARPDAKMTMAGGGLSLGPESLPFSLEVGPATWKSMGSQIHFGPRSVATSLDPHDLVGIGMVIGMSLSGPGAGGNGSLIMFGIGLNRPLSTLPLDILNMSRPGSPIGFMTDAFNTCQAFCCTIGLFAGVSIGVSMVEGLVTMKGPSIRPDPSVLGMRFR